MDRALRLAFLFFLLCAPLLSSSFSSPLLPLFSSPLFSPLFPSSFSRFSARFRHTRFARLAHSRKSSFSPYRIKKKPPLGPDPAPSPLHGERPIDRCMSVSPPPPSADPPQAASARTPPRPPASALAPQEEAASHSTPHRGGDAWPTFVSFPVEDTEMASASASASTSSRGGNKAGKVRRREEEDEGGCAEWPGGGLRTLGALPARCADDAAARGGVLDAAGRDPARWGEVLLGPPAAGGAPAGDVENCRWSLPRSSNAAAEERQEEQQQAKRFRGGGGGAA